MSGSVSAHGVSALPQLRLFSKIVKGSCRGSAAIIASNSSRTYFPHEPAQLLNKKQLQNRSTEENSPTEAGR